MLTIIQALLLGVLQGVTEWLPISSSGHLAIAQHYLGLGLQVPIAFDVMLHVATLLVILVFFRRDIWDMLAAAARRDFGSPHGRLFLLIIVGMVPTAIIGLALRSFFESMFSSMAAIAGALIITGTILVLSRRGSGSKELGWLSAALVGIGQGIAVAPGISRSGATIGTALFAGIKREQAVRFSFLLAAPAIAGAMLFEAGSLAMSGIAMPALAAGFAASFIVGSLSLKLLIRLVAQKRFSWFAVYCFALGIALLLAAF